VPEEHFAALKELPEDPEKMIENIAEIRAKAGLPFLATDRNVLNLPGVGKSLTYRVIGITRYGRRILEFDHDTTRPHSPIIEKMGKVIIIESKSVTEYLHHLADIGENIADYRGIFGYSIGVTEPRMPLYEYPDYDFELTDEVTNLDLNAISEPVARA
jgi:lysine 2,3-aminomutase